MLKMQAILDGKMNGMNFEEFKKSGALLLFGIPCFRCLVNGEEKSVDFDWDFRFTDIKEDGTLVLKEFIPDSLNYTNLTAKTLASTFEIENFLISYCSNSDKCKGDYLHIQSIVFEDETGKYAVDGEVLDRFNEMKIFEEILMTEADLEYAMSNTNFEEYEDEVLY